ncbi:WD40 repeat-like protein [Suillus weaverae]|nr:WD40 repeat-like protein [Suillus weaverae]
MQEAQEAQEAQETQEDMPWSRPKSWATFSSTTETQDMSVIMPRQTMRGYSSRVRGVVHLPGGRRIIACSEDGSLRLWDLESGARIGDDWQDFGNKALVITIALSPNGMVVASGSSDGRVMLWDVETGKATAKWSGNTGLVRSVSWSTDGKRVVSGSAGGTVRVWDVKSRKPVLGPIKTGHAEVYTVVYSPDSSKIATGGDDEDAVKIWDTKTSELIATLKHDWAVHSLAWTSDGQKLISVSIDSIWIFDTATWEQIATLNGHTRMVCAITLSGNNRLLASTSYDCTARLWNLDTNLQVGPPIHHKDDVECAVLSADGKLLVTGCNDNNAYVWDTQAILKEAGLETLLSITDIPPKNGLEHKAHASSHDASEIRPISSSSQDIDRMSFLEVDATQFGGADVDELSPAFFDGMEADLDSPTHGAHPHSSTRALLGRLFSLLHRSRPDSDKPIEQPSRPSRFHPHAFIARLSSFIHRSSPKNDAPNELQQPPTSSRSHSHALLARLLSLLRSRPNADEEIQVHSSVPSSSRADPDALISRLSSLFRLRPHTNEELELQARPRCLHVVEVVAMRDREVLFVAPRPQPNRLHAQPNGTTTPCSTPAHPLLLRLLAHLVLFLCCASLQHTDDNGQPTQEGQSQAHGTTSQTQQQQQGQSQGQVQAQSSSSQTQPAAASTSATPTTPDPRTIVPGAANVQPRPLPLRTRFVLFLCCASPPYADGH